MIIFPAIDVRGGNCVRLLQGRADMQTVYGNRPSEMAERFFRAGARALHMVDLDGAFSGDGKNLEAIAEAVRAVKIPVQLGGGIRTMDDIDDRLVRVGVARVILGTAAVSHPELVREAVRKYPGRIAVGIDAKDGHVAVRGWLVETDETPVSLAKKMRGFGVNTVVYTDISRDGMQSGVNVTATKALIDATGMRVIASGGIGSLADVRNVAHTGAYGVIIGKAIYEGAVSLADVLALEEEK